MALMRATMEMPYLDLPRARPSVRSTPASPALASHASKASATAAPGGATRLERPQDAAAPPSVHPTG